MNDVANIQINWNAVPNFQLYLYDDEELLVDNEFLNAP